MANVVQERNTLKVHVAGIGTIVAQAREEAVQEYRANFKDTDDYLDLMKDATMVYKESLKWVDPGFDVDYYDRLILGEPQTLSPEDRVGFDQLDPIGTLRTAAGLSTEQDIAPVEEQAADLTEDLVQ